MKIEKTIEIVGRQWIPWQEVPILKALAIEVKNQECLVAVCSYNYGFIKGKRHERARRNNKVKGGVSND